MSTGGLSPTSSSSRSRSPSTPPTSCHTSPQSKTSTLDPTMSHDDNESTTSSRGTPNRVSVDLPRTQTTGKGGCWTCRLRRKKCDEQRDGDSCKTCKRLTIQCLGWGTRRPEWMKDKQQVEAYKADIKAQLIRAGLVRGQPRSALAQQGAPRPAPRRPNPQHRDTLPEPVHSDVQAQGLQSGVTYPQVVADSFPVNNSSPQHLSTANVDPPSSHHLLTAESYDSHLVGFDLPHVAAQQLYELYPPMLDNTPSSSFADRSALEYAPSRVAPHPSAAPLYPLDVRPPSPQLTSIATSPRENCVMYYFEHVRSAQFVFAGNAVTNVTYTLILQNPHGALTTAICALASLHYHRMQVSRGVEEPSADRQAQYFYMEAHYQLTSIKASRPYDEGDAMAALHLVCYSQMSGGMTDWVQMFQAACDWLSSTGLPNDEHPMPSYHGMNEVAQLAVKMILWIDIFASPAMMRTPRFAHLYKRLFDSRTNPWGGVPVDKNCFPIGMEALSGCPEDAMMGMIEVSTLAFWKVTQKRNGSLSLRELIRRGDAIEEMLRQRRVDCPQVDKVPLHPGLVSSTNAQDAMPSDEMRQTIRRIFRETVSLYLQVVVNDANPGVPEIRGCVNTIVSLFGQLPSSVADRALVLPICLAGCMAEDSRQRDAFKGRLRKQDECIGNIMKCRLVMEAVWQKRDVTGGVVDWRDVLQEREYNLLLI